jgi:hypothetical protein
MDGRKILGSALYETGFYFRLLCKVMWLPSEFRHVTQKLSLHIYRNNRMCDITELVDFTLRKLDLGDD